MAKKSVIATWLGLGCLGMMLLCTGGIVTVGYGIFTALKHTGPYHDAVAQVRSSPDALAALGKPIETGWMVSGSVQEGLHGGKAALAIPVSGPKGSGVIQVSGTRTGKSWTYSVLTLRLNGSGKKIDLRPAAARTAATKAAATPVSGPASGAAPAAPVSGTQHSM